MKKNSKKVAEVNFNKIAKIMNKLLNVFAQCGMTFSTKKNTVTKNIQPKSLNTKKRICAISTKNNRKRYFNTLTECANKLNIDHGNMSKAINGKRKTAGGYRFEYVD